MAGRDAAGDLSRRHIGELKDGAEASFLILKQNPLADWKATHAIAGRWKRGQELLVGDSMQSRIATLAVWCEIERFP